MSEKICGIYKITNKVNGKVYIGQSRDIKRRWYEHRKVKGDYDRHSYPLYSAIEKYGIDNFEFEIIEKFIGLISLMRWLKKWVEMVIT